MASPFEDASTVEPAGEARFRADIPDGWQQGRGAFGGLVLGTLLRAMERAEPDRARAARTLAGDLSGPVRPGPAEIAVRVLRRGSNQSNLLAELRQGGEVLAVATAVLSPPRGTHAPRTLYAPPPPSRWREIEPLAMAGGTTPTFAAHYEYRNLGPLPFSARGDAVTEGWLRERVPPARLDAPALIARLDAWWPTLFSLDPSPRPVATVSFVAELLADPAALPAEEPLRYRAHMAALRDGFFVELRELWSGDRLVAMNQQTFAILR